MCLTFMDIKVKLVHKGHRQHGESQVMLNVFVIVI